MLIRKQTCRYFTAAPTGGGSLVCSKLRRALSHRRLDPGCFAGGSWDGELLANLQGTDHELMLNFGEIASSDQSAKLAQVNTKVDKAIANVSLIITENRCV